MSVNFTVPEVNIIVMYKGDTKEQTIENITDAYTHIQSESANLEAWDICENVISKLDKITDEEFSAEIFIPEYGDG